MGSNYITPAGVEKLRRELKELLHSERPQLVKTVAWAASNGDRSENADYIYGKRRLREIDKRVEILTKKIEEAQIVDPHTIRSETIVFGARVTLVDEEGQRHVYKIVGEDEIDVEKGFISWRSPIASALLGKRAGEEVVIKRPAGDWFVEVSKIEFI